MKSGWKVINNKELLLSNHNLRHCLPVHSRIDGFQAILVLLHYNTLRPSLDNDRPRAEYEKGIWMFWGTPPLDVTEVSQVKTSAQTWSKFLVVINALNWFFPLDTLERRIIISEEQKLASIEEIMSSLKTI